MRHETPFGAVPLSVSAAEKRPAVRLRAFAVDLTNSAHTRLLDIVIERWSTPEEIKTPRAASSDGGSDALLGALQNTAPRCGYVTGGVQHSNIHAASESPIPGGRPQDRGRGRPACLVLGGLGPLDAARVPLVDPEIRLGPHGKGEGNAIPYAKVAFAKDTNTLLVENYERLPLRVVQVSVVGSK